MTNAIKHNHTFPLGKTSQGRYLKLEFCITKIVHSPKKKKKNFSGDDSERCNPSFNSTHNPETQNTEK